MAGRTFEVRFRGRYDAPTDWQSRTFASRAEALAFAEGLAYGDEPAYVVLYVGASENAGRFIPDFNGGRGMRAPTKEAADER